jgi:hypothetical protein
MAQADDSLPATAVSDYLVQSPFRQSDLAKRLDLRLVERHRIRMSQTSGSLQLGRKVRQSMVERCCSDYLPHADI